MYPEKKKNAKNRARKDQKIILGESKKVYWTKDKKSFQSDLHKEAQKSFSEDT